LPGLILGNVDLLEVNLRGVNSAAMAYNQNPWIDHFRVLNSSNGTTVLLGIFSVRQRHGGWFMLRSRPDFNKATEGVHRLYDYENAVDESDDESFVPPPSVKSAAKTNGNHTITTSTSAATSSRRR